MQCTRHGSTSQCTDNTRSKAAHLGVEPRGAGGRGRAVGRPLARFVTGHGGHGGCSGGDEEGAQSLYHMHPGVIGVLGATLAHDDVRLELESRAWGVAFVATVTAALLDGWVSYGLARQLKQQYTGAG